MQISSNFTAYPALMFTVLCWGLSFVAIKIALESFSTFSLIFIRFSIAALVFLGIMLFRGFPSFTRREHLQIFCASLFQPGLYFWFETTGLQHSSASKASLIIAAIPIVVLCLASVFLKERLEMTTLLGTTLSLVGISLLIVQSGKTSSGPGNSVMGDLLILGAVFSMAFYTIIMKHAGSTRSAIEITGLQMCYGALIFAPAFLWQLPELRGTVVATRSLIALAGLTLFATLGAFVCYNYALARLSASRTAIFLNCVPLVATLAAWKMLGERLSLLQMSGGGLILFSVYLTNAFKERHLNVELTAKELQLNETNVNEHL